MKCSKAIEILEIFRDEGEEDLPLDVEPAINLAICCITFRLAQTQVWALSGYALLPGEDREDA